MIRRYNYTKRQKIKSELILIQLNREEGKIISFSATIDLSNLDFPKDADVFIEPYHQTERIRIPLGKVKNTIDIEDQSLSLLGRHENIKFRILVVDNSNEIGQIIAFADKLHPINEDKNNFHKHGILLVDFKDLGRQTWRIEFGEAPVLIFNNRVQNIHGIVRSDPSFFFYVFPSVIRDILIYLFFIEKIGDYENLTEEWHKNWIDFSKMFNSSDIPENSEENKEIIIEWIDYVIDGFCNSRHKDWKKFLKFIEG